MEKYCDAETKEVGTKGGEKFVKLCGAQTDSNDEADFKLQSEDSSIPERIDAECSIVTQGGTLTRPETGMIGDDEESERGSLSTKDAKASWNKNVRVLAQVDTGDQGNIAAREAGAPRKCSVSKDTEVSGRHVSFLKDTLALKNSVVAQRCTGFQEENTTQKMGVHESSQVQTKTGDGDKCAAVLKETRAIVQEGAEGQENSVVLGDTRATRYRAVERHRDTEASQHFDNESGVENRDGVDRSENPSTDSLHDVVAIFCVVHDDNELEWKAEKLEDFLRKRDVKGDCAVPVGAELSGEYAVFLNDIKAINDSVVTQKCAGYQEDNTTEDMVVQESRVLSTKTRAMLKGAEATTSSVMAQEDAGGQGDIGAQGYSPAQRDTKSLDDSPDEESSDSGGNENSNYLNDSMPFFCIRDDGNGRTWNTKKLDDFLRKLNEGDFSSSASSYSSFSESADQDIQSDSESTTSDSAVAQVKRVHPDVLSESNSFDIDSRAQTILNRLRPCPLNTQSSSTTVITGMYDSQSSAYINFNKTSRSSI